MATARLINPREVKGGVAFTVETWPANDGLFTGAAHRGWSDFVVVSRGIEATFEWRTPAHRVRFVAGMVVAGTWSVARALEDDAVASWVDRCGDDFLFEFEDEDPELRDISDEDFAGRMLVEVGAHVKNAVFYGEDDDSAASDAAYSLPLPRWARVRESSEGGPGTGYTDVSIVLASGRTLDDLAAFLRSQP
jgi:hypothetical protein